MSIEWSSDFSYGYFRKILQTIKTNFELHLLSEAPQILNTNGQPKLILRHDVDVSIKKALRMAEIENEYGIRSSYMVSINSPFYYVEDKMTRDILQKLISMGHEVALHFDFETEDSNINYGINSIDVGIQSACKQLENIIGLPVKSVSFHRPMQQILRGPLIISDMVNACAKELMTWYLSDSMGKWREGEPLPKLFKPKRPFLQLLIHPTSWGDEHMLLENHLQEFYDVESQGKSPEYAKMLDDALVSTIPAVRRRGFKRGGGEQ